MKPSALFGSSQPLYQMIAEKLMAGIQSGEYPVGTLLPSESQLCATHNVSRHTVREAVRALSRAGLVDAQAGIGTRVIEQRFGGYVQRLKEIADLNDYVAQTRREVLRIETVCANDVDVQLPGPATQSWRMIEARRSISGTKTVVAWTQVFVKPAFGSVLESIGSNALVYSLIEREFGIRTERLRQTITAIATPPNAATHLDLAVGAPALAIMRDYIDQNGEVYEVSWSIHPPERYQNKAELVLSHET